MKIKSPKTAQSPQNTPYFGARPQKASIFEALPTQLIEDALVPAIPHGAERLAFAQTSKAAHRAHMRAAALRNVKNLKIGLTVTLAESLRSPPPSSPTGYKEAFYTAQKRALAVYSLKRLEALVLAHPAHIGAQGSQIGVQIGRMADALEAIGQAAMAAAGTPRSSRYELSIPMASNLRGSFRMLQMALTQRLDTWAATETGEDADAVTAKNRILEAIARKSSHLDLSNLGLRTLPPLADYLPWLRSLNGSANFLSTFVEELKVLKKLRIVDLSDNSIEVIPAEIEQLTSLASLNLAFNVIATIPPQLGNLIRLRTLNLSGNEIGELPGELGKLKGLRCFNLATNYLTTLPDEMGHLKALKTLNLSDNIFTIFPLQLTQLSALERLDLSENVLIRCAAEIANMLSLKVLDLHSNPIELLPVEIGKLASLKVLNLRDTAILSLPKQLRQLSLTLLRRPQTLSGLLFDDFLHKDWQIGEIKMTLQQLTKRNIALVDMFATAVGLDKLQEEFDTAVETDLKSFYNRVTITL